MFVAILSIVALALVLWMFLFARFFAWWLRTVLLRFDPRRDESPVDDEPIDDPYDVGMNDQDLL
jgi:hypothetical protein